MMRQTIADEYNAGIRGLFKRERERQGFSHSQLSYGVVSSSTLNRMELGERGWKKMSGDFMLQRLGIPNHYFEYVITDEELKEWKEQEDICRILLSHYEEAGRRLQSYEAHYSKKSPLNRLFAEKIKCIRLLQEWARKPDSGRAGQVMEQAGQTVTVTMPYGWEERMADIPLAPDELEAVLLLCLAKRINGRPQEAWKLLCMVWEYPGIRRWDREMKEYIWPAAAMAALWKRELWEGMYDAEIYRMGGCALECLRESRSGRYALPLLEAMVRHPCFGQDTEKKRTEWEEFRTLFCRMNEEFEGSQNRIWQNIDVGNSYPASIYLKQMRKANRKNIREAAEGNEDFMNKTHLGRIEQGRHTPAASTMAKLMSGYGRGAESVMPLVETTSSHMLSLRQEITTLFSMRKWQDALLKISVLKNTSAVKGPRMEQELLFWEAMLKDKDGKTQEALQLLEKALRCTVDPAADLGQWVFQREEGIIAKNIAAYSAQNGDVEKALYWYERLYGFVRGNRMRSLPLHKCESLILCGYAELLGNLGRHREAMAIDSEALAQMSRITDLGVMSDILYDWAWNARKVTDEDGTMEGSMEEQGRKYFLLAYSLSGFIRYDSLYQWLQHKKEEYLMEQR